MTKLSLSDFNARTASARGYEFEYLVSGQPTGLFITVQGANSETVQAAINAEVNGRRRREAILAAKRAKARTNDAPEFETVEEDLEFGQRMAALRITGWRGVSEPYTPETALQLVRNNPEIATQVLEASNDLGNFMRPSPTM